jgi:hypothetical protein
MVKPFSPSEAKLQAQRNKDHVADEVVVIINSFLAQYANSDEIIIEKSELVEAISKRFARLSECDINAQLQLFPVSYRENGWNVEFVKPRLLDPSPTSRYWIFTPQ